MKHVLTTLALACASPAQTPAPATVVAGVGNFSHIVANLERSVAFYRDVIGLEMNLPPQTFSGNPAIMKMGNTPGAQSRISTLKVPGSQLGVELIEYKDIDRKPADPGFEDPGAANLILTVRDLDAVMARVKQAGTRIVTKAGGPVTMDAGQGKSGNAASFRVVFLKDPDGFFVEMSQRNPTPLTTAPSASNVIGGNFEFIANNVEQTAKFYRDALGFDTRADPNFHGDKLRMETAGTPGAQYKRGAAPIPGSTVQMAFLEFKDIARHPLSTRIQDPGTAILQLRIRDLDVAVKALKAAGATVISEGGAPTDFGNGRRLVIVRDPNNLFLELLPAP